MSFIKQTPVSGVVAFGPRSLLAIGTAAGSINHDFSTDSQLEIYALDFRHSGKDLQRLGAAPSSDRFHCLSWGTLRSDVYHDGIIAAGLASGTIEIWDPAKLAAGKGEAARITKLDKHKGPVMGLEFNALSPHLLASAGLDGQLAIWDLTDPQKPKQYAPMKARPLPRPCSSTEGHQQGPKAEISQLAWNPKIPHILATCTTAGTVTVWDLKKQATVLNLSDNQGRMKSCSAVAWNPTNSTQLVAACDHQLSPTLHRWDLRSPNMPFELLGHDQGVMSVSWCKHEASYLLSSGKDGKVILWDAPQGRALGAFSVGLPGVTAHQVRWSPASPGLFAIATMGGPDGHGKVSLHTLAAFTEPAAPAEEGAPAAALASPLLQAPEWMKRPAGACFGFGGKLAAFKTVRAESGAKQVVTSISQVITERTLVEESGSFEEAVLSKDKAALADFCTAKASRAPPDEAESWAFMRLLFEDDSRGHLLAHLGFQDIVPQADAAGDDGGLAAHAESLQLTSPRSAPGTSPPQRMPEANGNTFKEEDGESFFENLPQAELPAPQVSRASTLSPRPITAEEHHAEAGESEGDIQRALYVGNYEAAVTTCLQAERMADALVIASVAGGVLFEKAQKEYMRRAPRPYMKIINAIMSHDLTGLVKSRPLDRWKETLALLCAYSEGEEFFGLCDLLAKRLAGAGLPGPATLAWICAANVDKAVRQWTRDLKASAPEPSAEALQSLMERAVVLGHGANKEEASPALAALVNQYAGLLAAQGRMGAALRYLSLVPGDVAPDIAVLKDRIHRSGAPDVYHSPEPMFPFIAEDVPVDPSAVQQQQAAAYSQQPTAYSQHPAPAGMSSAASTGADYYNRNQYHVHGGYSKPGGPSYDSSGYSSMGYGGSQAQQAGYGSGYDNSSYSSASAGGAYQSTAAYQSAPQAAPVPQFAPQSRPAMPPGSASYASQMGGGPAQQAPAYAPQPSRAASQPPKPAWQPQAAPAAAPPAAPTQAAWQPAAAPAAQPAPAPRAPSWQPQQAPEPQTMFAPAASASSGALPPVATQQAPPPAFQPRASPAQTPNASYGQHPSPFGQAGQSGPVTPPKPAPLPAPTGPPANVNVSNVDTSKVRGEDQVIVSTLRDLVQSFITNAGAHPGKKREAEDNSKKIGALFWRLNAGELSPDVQNKLRALVAAIKSGNGQEASSVQMDLTSNHWNEVGSAMTALKRMLKQILR